VGEQTYTGKAIKPAVKVFFGETELEEKKDYTIAYANNTNAGMATFTVIGKGSYTGTASGAYRIVAQDISKLTATLDPKAYTGKEVKLTKGDIKRKSGGKFINDVTFDFDEDSYKNNVNKGKATVVVKGTGNYGGTKTITFTIGSKGILWWWRNLFN
ncbi:MAG: preprotein translocase subunit TatA, partial [Lachnospiraceae bacterium]|nr:preprotein translocase subunit TatA [Lachnospiraceae bacterium]